MVSSNSDTSYRGRFAPSPSGPLHAGSLIAALGSYLDARAAGGQWLVRIEDIDPPREVPGADAVILSQLEAHGLHWDGPVRYQSQQHALYQSHLDDLHSAGLLYACDCTRKQIKARAPYYTGFCRSRGLAFEQNALRFFNRNPVTTLNDRFHGAVTVQADWAGEDFVLRRRDGLWAYQLAVVSDDREQGITEIVRGSDLLTPTAWQLTLWQALNQVQQRPVNLPRLAHLPLVLGSDGRKLSKQNHAPAIDNNQAAANLTRAIGFLGMHLPTDLEGAAVELQLDWAQAKWPSHVENFTV
ncbi:tRNA glutamyl-Q(34) synthetase GluQRS [Aliidiomarina soli]|uniref:Glutamyl-Q tRNA(Asp) synthetase n=1 Tax=Aliidiomarina soli TaxID=1928574 RepID=A0A432WDU7_9GAMM|nr:tRNA glutamyl-Q(34) synthetase GluQRS [Aliidiomarina soli]RUO31025.1 tRNA glutamyl-Q(34) synthetase GluQRS [Aliidiomarina soli]